MLIALLAKTILQMPEISPAKPKVALIGPSFPYRGGIAYTTTELAKALRRRNSLDHFFTPYALYPKFLYPGKTDKRSDIPAPDFAQALYSGFNPLSWKKLKAQLMANKVDVCLFPFWTAANIPLLNYLSHFFRIIPLVHNISDHDSGVFHKKISTKALSVAHAYFCHAPSVKTELQKLFPHKQTRCSCEPASFFLSKSHNKNEAREKLQIPHDKTVFLFYGLIRRYKGVEVLLDAITKVKRQDALFIVAGEIWENEKKIRRLSEKLPIKTDFNWVSEENSALYFSAADFCVLPYLRATGSGVVAKAKAYGLPLIASKALSAGTLTPGNSDELAFALENAKTTSASSTFSTWDDVAHEIVSLIDEVMQ